MGTPTTRAGVAAPGPSPGRSSDEGWARLAASRGPAEQPAWVRAWAEAFRVPELVLVTAGPEAHPSALAPLARIPGRRGRLELAGVRGLHEPSGLLHEDEDALEELARRLVRTRAHVALPRMWAGAPAVGALRRAYRGRGVVRVRPAGETPVIPLGDGWTEPERMLTARRRSDLRRAGRRAMAAGGAASEVLCPGPEETGGLLDEAFGLEARGWKGRAGSALARDPARGAFMRLWAREAAARGELRIAFLRIGGARVAMQIACERAGRLWLLKIGHDEAVARCSPGSLLLCETIAWAAHRGLESYELLGRREPWTGVWTGHARPTVAVSAFPLSGAGLAALAASGGRMLRARLADGRPGR